MKEWENWYDDYIKKVGYNRSGKTYTKAAWKAALEWAIKDLEQYLDEWELDSLDDIKKELEE